MEGGKNSSNSCGAVPVRCGPVPLTSALWPPRRPHVPPACQYRLALRVAFVPRAPVAMRDAYPWPQGRTGEDRVPRLKFSLSERLPQGLADRQKHRRTPDAEALSTLPNVQRLHEWRWRVSVIGEMVLGNEAIVETECLRVLDLLYPLFEEKLPIYRTAGSATRKTAQIAWCVPIMFSTSIVGVSHSSAMLGHHRTKSNGLPAR